MRRFLLFLVAAAGLPLAWALGRAFLEGAASGLTAAGPLLTPGRTGFLAGALGMFLLYVWKGRAMGVTYVFAHEMTHAVAGLLCLARVHRVSVRETGGFVELSKSNLFITLAPYCVPFYLLLALGLFAAVDWLWPGATPFWAWAALFGACAAFHALYTLDALLSVSQPDVREYGRFFSYWLIVTVNLFFASVALVASGQTGAFEQTGRALRRTVGAYAGAWRAAAHAAAAIPLPERNPEP